MKVRKKTNQIYSSLNRSLNRRNSFIIFLLVILLFCQIIPSAFVSALEDEPPTSADEQVLFEIVDRREGAETLYLVTEALAEPAYTDEILNYSRVNRYGSPGKELNVGGGIVLKDLFNHLGIIMNPADCIEFISADGYNSAMLWGYLMAERYYYPNLPVSFPGNNGQAPPDAYADPVPVPAIIALNNDGTLMFGQQAPHEQTYDAFVKYLGYIEAVGVCGRIILTDAQAVAFDSITATDPADGAQVALGSEITLSWQHLGYSDGYVYFTTGDTPESTPDPDVTSSIYNFNTYNGSSGNLFKPVVKTDDDLSRTFTIKTIVLGKRRLPSEITVFTYSIEGRGPQERSASDIAKLGEIVGGVAQIIGTTLAMEYRLDGWTEWFPCSEGTTSAAAGSYYVRYRETNEYLASPVTGSITVTAATKLPQEAPDDLAGQRPQGNEPGRITGTTTAMQYRAENASDDDWQTCDDGFTEAAIGQYYVRYAETAAHYTSLSVGITVGKALQDAPDGLTGIKPGSAEENGRICETTVAMEYSGDEDNWIECGDGFTEVSPGTYYVRYKETANNEASAAVAVVVPVCTPISDDVVLTVYDGETLVKSFTRAELDELGLTTVAVYSGYNTYPTYEDYYGVQGYSVIDILATAGFTSLSSNTAITFRDGGSTPFTATLTWGQIAGSRYYYSFDGIKGDEVPVILDETLRLYFGQTAATEQIRDAYVNGVVSISTGSDAGTWGIPAANPVSGSTVSSGDLIRLAIPDCSGNAKIYYTLDGSDPTMDSPIYNRIGDDWLNSHGLTENPPIIVQGGSNVFTVKAYIMGLGRDDGEVATFTYNLPQQQQERSAEDLTKLAAVTGGEGQIIATTTEMEYRLDGETEWTPCTEGTTLAAAGACYIRYAESNSYFASEAAGPIIVTATVKQIQTAPDNLTAVRLQTDDGKGRIVSTTTAMEYTEVDSGNDWLPCDEEYTEVTPGQYHVRYAETDSHYASPEATVTVGKMQQNPPAGLTGQMPASASVPSGRINGTTAAMQYSDDLTNWFNCGEVFTAATPKQYYIRYMETATREASSAVSVSVPVYSSGGGGDNPPPAEDKTVFTVYNGAILAKGFTQAEINALPKVTNNYSTYNTYPTYSANNNIAGVEVMLLLAEAGLYPSGGREITFYGSDGFNATLKADDLTVPRYFFSRSGVRGNQVPAVVSFGSESSTRLYFGQVAAQEQTNQAFVNNLDRIVVGGQASRLGTPIADPEPGSRVKKGGLIRLSLPGGSGDAKLYYTLDGSSPTVESFMYNKIAERWFDNQSITENQPIIAPADWEFTVTARLIGLGMDDGDEVAFTYNPGISPPKNLDTDNKEDSGLAPEGAAVVEKDATNQGDAPSVSYSAEELKESIQEAASEEGVGVLELNILTVDTATSVEVSVPAQSIKEMIDAGLQALIVSSPLGAHSYDLAALQSIYAQGGEEELTFYTGKANPAGLNEAMQEAVGDNILYQIEIYSGGKSIENFGRGEVTTRLKYDLSPDQSAYGVKVWRLAEDGTLTDIQCEYDSVRGYVQFTRNSHSFYMIGYDAATAAAALEQANNPFIDVSEEDWFYGAVCFVNEQGIMTGTSREPKLFSPDMFLTRAMLVSIIYRLQGSGIRN